VTTPYPSPSPSEPPKGCEQATDKGGYCHNWIVPEPPTWVDECGPDNGHWVLPEVIVGGKYVEKVIGAVHWIAFVPNFHDEYLVKPGSTLLWHETEKNVTPCVTALPTQFSAEPTPPTCDTDGSLPTLEGVAPSLIPSGFPHVDLHFDRPYDGPGTYTLIADALDGYTFPDGTTHKEREITVGGALGYQSDDPEAPCFFAAPQEVTLTPPTVDDECGTANDFANLPPAAEGVVYSWVDENDDDNLDVLATVAEGALVNVTVGWIQNGANTYVYDWTYEFDDTACPVTTPTPEPTTPPLAATGLDTDYRPWALGAGAGVMAGIALLTLRRVLSKR
jgi:hypothetical protein